MSLVLELSIETGRYFTIIKIYYYKLSQRRFAQIEFDQSLHLRSHTNASTRTRSKTRCKLYLIAFNNR